MAINYKRRIKNPNRWGRKIVSPRPNTGLYGTLTSKIRKNRHNGKTPSAKNGTSEEFLKAQIS
jgi:hypothetical protein